MRSGALALVVAALVVGASAATADVVSVDEPGTASAPAVRSAPFGDVVSVNEPSRLSTTLANDVLAAAAEVGAAALPGRSAQIGLVRLSRNGTPVQVAPSGYQYPMGLTVVPLDAAAFVLSAGVAEALARGQVVIGATSARIRGAQVGDLIELLDTGGNVRSFVIGRVADDTEVGGAELVMRDEEAAVLGVTTPTRMIVWGFDSRTALDAALARHGVPRTKVRVSRSWDPPSPDSTIGLAQTKALLGEFAFRRLSSGSIAIEPGWVDANIEPRRTFAGVGIRASCHKVVAPAIQGALSELAAAGLAGLIELTSTNTVGGCFSPRLNTVSGNLGFLSRHTWAMALDLNITQNPQGATPRLDCRVVRVFRKWGFAWGGNFVNPDGMHFEYVGERRDQLAFPSPYCPNIIEGSADRVDRHGSDATDDQAGRTALFADDGLSDGHE